MNYPRERRLRRYIEASLFRGLAWVVLEPNGEPLWAEIRSSVEDFMFGLWQAGMLHGATPEQAYFVKCDRTTITQVDWESNKVVILIGYSARKPADFEILRIEQGCGAPQP
jgi:uncharacterized protein